jgi:hypothetical protein
MNKKTKVFMVVAVLILILWISLTCFKKCHKSELSILVDRYWEIQDEYNLHQWIINDLHNEAEWIREEALDKYGIVFTEAWLETVK